MVIILLKGKWKHLPRSPHSTENTRGNGLKTSLPVKPFGFGDLYVVAYICYCFHHSNEVENLLSPAATPQHEAGEMEESGLSLFHDDTTACRQCFTEP